MKLLLIHIGIQFPDDLQTKKTIFSKHRHKIKPQHCIIVCTVKNVKLRLIFSLLNGLASIKLRTIAHAGFWLKVKTRGGISYGNKKNKESFKKGG